MRVPSQPKADPGTVAALRALGEMGAARDFVATSSGALAQALGVSQQTASRRILELVGRGLLQRRMAARHQLLRLSPEGMAVLRRELEGLRAVVEGGARGERLVLRGRVATGLGEGAWYIARRGYTEGLRGLLGFAPWPGTLNVALEGPEAEKLARLAALPGLLVREFEDEGRSFGAVKCFPGTLRGIEVGAVLPARGHHKAVLEVVAPLNLREKLGLRDGDAVEVEVEAAVPAP